MRFHTTNHNSNCYLAPQGVCFEPAPSLTGDAKRTTQPLALVASLLLVLLIAVGIVGSVAQAQTVRQLGTFNVLPQPQVNSYLSSTPTYTTSPVLNGATYVKVGPDGSIYVADTLNDRIVKYVPTTVTGYSSCPGGMTTPAAPTMPITSTAYCQYILATPAFNIRGIAIDSAGDVYFTNYNGTTTLAYYYLKYLGVPTGTASGNAYNGYGCASSSTSNTVKCSNYTTIATTTAVNKPEGLFVDSYGTVFIASYGAQYILVERPTSAVTPGTTPPTAAASYTEMTLGTGSYMLDVVEDQWGNIFAAAYSSGLYEFQCGSGTSCTPSTSSFTGAKTSGGNGYGATAGPPATLATASGTHLSSIAVGEGQDGVALDGAGNLYALFNIHSNQSARVFEFPLTAPGTYSATGFDVFATLTAPNGVLGASEGTGTTMTAIQGMAFDPTHPNVMYVGAGVNVDQFTLGANGINGPVNFGSSPIGTPVTKYVNMVATSSTAATSIYAVTLDNSTSDFAVATSTSATSNPYCNVGATLAGSSSSVAYGGGCIVGVTFTPSHAGTEYGAVIFASSSAILGWGYLEGTGTGAVADFGTPTESVIATPTTPTGLTLDSSGNLYYTATGLAHAVQLASGTWTATSLNDSTALTAATSITMDGAGILYVADSGNTHVQKFAPAFSGSLTGFTQSNFGVGTALSSGYGVFVDAYGSLYIANTGLNQVQIEPWNGVNANTTAPGWGTEVLIPAPSSLSPATISGPKAVTVDGSGNVYVADSGNGRVLKYTLTTPITGGVYVPTYTPTVVTSTATNPTALSLDPNGNLYIADAGTNKVYKETYSGGSYTESTIPTSTLSGPLGLVVAPNGNIFIADTGNNRILEENVASAPTVAFGSSPVATATSPQTVTLVNNGNAPLNATVPGSGLNPALSNADYSLATGSGSECAQASSGGSAQLLAAAGGSCTLPITFDPSLSGADNGTLTITDNSNTATTVTQTITLTGSGTGAKVSSTTTIPTITAVGYGSSLSVTVNVTGSTSPVPSGNVTLTVDTTTTVGTQALSNGSSTFAVADIAAGTHTFTASYVGDSNNNSSSTSGSTSGTVNKAVLTVTSNSPTAITYGQSDPSYTYSVTGYEYTDNASVITGTPTLSTSPSTPVNAGSYTINVDVSGLSATNYTFTPASSGSLTINKAALTVTSLSPAAITYGQSDPSYTYSITGYLYTDNSSVITGTPTLSTTPSSPTTVGSYTINVDVSGLSATNYTFTPVSAGSLTINKATPVVSWSAPSAITYGTALSSTQLDASSGGVAGTFVYSPASGTVLGAGAGQTLNVTFTPTDGTNYTTATGSTTITVNKETQTITGFAPSSPVAYGSGNITLSVGSSGASGNAVTFSVVSGPGSISSGNILSLTGVGTIVVAADQASSANYSAATEVTANIVVNQATQTITGFAPPATANYGSGNITLSVGGSGASGNSVTFSVLSGPGSISSGNILSITGVGTIVVAADQAGNTDYAAATEVTASITVSKGSQTITFTQPSTPVSYGVSPIALSASGGASGNSVTFSVLSGPGTITGGTNLTVTGVGTIVVAADQLGNSNYNAASEVTHSVVVNQASTTSSVVSTSYSIVPGTSVTLTATVTSGATGTVTFKNGSTVIGSASLSSGTASISTSSLPLGTDSITVVYGGDSNFAGSTSSAISISVAYMTPTVVLSCNPTSVVPGQPTTCTATVSGSGGTPTGSVTFAATSTGATQGTLGSGTVNGSGVATYYGLIWGGTDVMTATYGGDSNYGSAASNSVTLSNYTNSGKLTFNWPFISWAQPVSYGASSGAWPVTLQNLTGQTVTPTIGIANSNFVISGSTCGTLVQGATCSFNVTFTPTSGGSPTGTAITSALTATTSTPSQDASINVTGIAVSSSLTFNWPFLNFTPTVAVGATSSPWPVTMTNSSGTTTTVNSIGFSDASFAVTSDTCTGQQLAAFASCTFNVTFSPIAADITQSGTNVISGVTMTASGNSGAVTGTLSVGGWAAAALGFNWPFITFQNQPIGSTGTNLWPVTVTNYSGSTVSGLSYNFTGVTNYQSGAFTLTNTCPSLAPGASCTFYIAPSPVSGQSASNYSAQLVVSGSGLSSPALSVSGSATQGGYSINWNQDQQAGVSTIDFGPQNVKNVTAGPWPITVYNNTGATHTLTISPSLGVFTYDSSTCTNVASGASCSFNLYFTPVADTYYNGTLAVSDGTNSYTFNTWGGANK